MMNFECTDKEVELLKMYRKLASDDQQLMKKLISMDGGSDEGKANKNIHDLPVMRSSGDDSEGQKKRIDAHHILTLINDGKFDIENEFNEQFYIAESGSGLLSFIMANGGMSGLDESVLFSTIYNTDSAVQNMCAAFEKLLDLYGNASKMVN